MSLDFHPYSEIFPLLPDAELAELAADIKAFGLREPIWLYEGKILDGRNRWIACQKAHVEPQFRTFRGEPKGAKALVWSANYHRRHLTESQRAIAAAELANLGKGQPERNASREAFTQTEAAEQAGISRSSVQRAKKVVDKGSHALRKAVKSGEIPVKKAASVVDLPKSEQLMAAKAKPQKAPEPEAPDPEEEAESIAEAAGAEFDARIARVLDADDKLKQMAAELKQAAQEIVALKQARDRYMNESSAMRQQLQKKDREIARLKKAAK